MLTLPLDGWSDMLGRDLYGVLAAEVNEYPIVLGLKDMTGVRATSDNILDQVVLGVLRRYGLEDVKNFVAVVTDNPTVMRSFRAKFGTRFKWLLVSILIADTENGLD